MRRRLVATTLITAATLVGAACSNGGTTAQTSTGGQAVGATDGSTVGAAGSPEPGAVIGTTQAQLRTAPNNPKPLPIRIDIMRLRASGDLVELELALTNEAPSTGDERSDRDLEFEPFSLFGDGNAKYDISGVGLVDPPAQKVYLPARDNADKCLCTGGFIGTDYGPGGTYTLTATFAGIPADTRAVDVRIPNFPAVTGVRIQR